MTDPPLAPVSGLIEPRHAALARQLGGGNTSAGLRMLVEAGVAATEHPGTPAMREVDSLRQLHRKLAAVVGRTTPSGSWWCPSDAAIPEAGLLDPGGDVISCGDGRRVILAGRAGALMADLHAAQLVLQVGDHSEQSPIGVADLALLVTGWLGAIQALEAGPGACNVGHCGELQLLRLPDGQMACRMQRLQVSFSCVAGLQFPAELLCLLAREALVRIGEVMQLEASLQVSP